MQIRTTMKYLQSYQKGSKQASNQPTKNPPTPDKTKFLQECRETWTLIHDVGMQNGAAILKNRFLES